MTPKSDIDIVREALERAEELLKYFDALTPKEEEMNCWQESLIKIAEALPALSNLSKQLEAAERMEEALENNISWNCWSPVDLGEKRLAERHYYEGKEALAVYQKSKEAK